MCVPWLMGVKCQSSNWVYYECSNTYCHSLWSPILDRCEDIMLNVLFIMIYFWAVGWTITGRWMLVVGCRLCLPEAESAIHPFSPRLLPTTCCSTHQSQTFPTTTEHVGWTCSIFAFSFILFALSVSGSLCACFYFGLVWVHIHLRLLQWVFCTKMS